MSAPAQVVQLNCPNCRNPLRAQIVTLIDVGSQPQLKNYVLSGQLNTVVCPNCGYASMLAAPLVYHDPAKQLFLTHFPPQLNARPEEQEKFIGDAASVLLRTLPPDAPKGYLLAPKRFLTLNSLVEAVLEADGVTKEMLAAQRARVELISELAETFEQSPESLPPLVEQRAADLDAEFFGTLQAFAEASARSGQSDSASLLAQLYERLVELTGFEGGELLEGEETADDDLAVEEALARLVEAEDEAVPALVEELRPAIDYAFFEAWTNMIDAAEERGDTHTAHRLTERRTAILAAVEAIDTQARAMFEAGAELLKGAMAAPDAEAFLREHVAEIDEAFLLVLDANREAAERGGQQAIGARLAEIRALAIQVAEDALTPEERFINQLLMAETTQAATEQLRQNFELVNGALVKRLNTLADEAETAGRKPEGERLRQLAREAGVMLF